MVVGQVLVEHPVQSLRLVGIPPDSIFDPLGCILGEVIYVSPVSGLESYSGFLDGHHIPFISPRLT